MTTLTIWSLVAETKEWAGPLVVTANGVPVSTFQVSVCEGAVRPTTWLAADDDPDGGATKGVLVGAGTSWPLAVGRKYMIYIKYTDNPEIPVLRAGTIRAT
jgi:hypothetical protein